MQAACGECGNQDQLLCGDLHGHLQWKRCLPDQKLFVLSFAEVHQNVWSTCWTGFCSLQGAPQVSRHQSSLSHHATTKKHISLNPADLPAKNAAISTLLPMAACHWQQSCDNDLQLLMTKQQGKSFKIHC